MPKQASSRARSASPASSTETTAPRTRKKRVSSKAAATASEPTSVEVSSTDAAPAAVFAREPSHEEISQRAFALFVARGGRDGDALYDWFAAEAQLRAS